MTDQPQLEEQRPTPRRRPAAIAWRIAAVAVIVVAMVAVTHFLRSPLRPESAGPGAALWGSSGSPTDELFAKPAPGEQDAKADEHRKMATADLRRMMAGILMHAADNEDPQTDPLNMDREARRRFLADRFQLPFDYPRSAVAPDLPPKGGEVLMVFDSPSGDGSRMVLVRVKVSISRAMSDLHKQYADAGWKPAGPLDPQAQTDRGWLMRFSRDRRDRMVYARPRQIGDETLLAIYESPR
jgi:hypothetical protein